MALEVTGKYQYPSPKPEWLALHAEPIVDPGLKIIDPHHHLWDEPGKNYFGEDFQADVATGHNIIATVCVQAHFGYRPGGAEHLKPVGETEHIESIRRDLAAREPGYGICSGIVGFADLMDPGNLDEVIDAHLRASPLHFRGIRQSVARDSHFPDGIVLRPAAPGIMAEPGFRRSLKSLGRRGLSFDAMLYHEQILDLVDLAHHVEDTQIILDHLGCPIGVGPYRGRERETFAAWRTAMGALAGCPNVRLKFGGLGMIILGADYHLHARPPSSVELASAWQPYFDVCASLFGADRCMFESNFPVDKAMFSYPVLWNAFKHLAAQASAEEKARLFSQTASDAYRLHHVMRD